MPASTALVRRTPTCSPSFLGQGIQVSALTQLARVRKQTMAQAVEELEKLGYVERRADPADGRARLVLPDTARRSGTARR